MCRPRLRSRPACRAESQANERPAPTTSIDVESVPPQTIKNIDDGSVAVAKASTSKGFGRRRLRWPATPPSRHSAAATEPHAMIRQVSDARRYRSLRARRSFGPVDVGGSRAGGCTPVDSRRAEIEPPPLRQAETEVVTQRRIRLARFNIDPAHGRDALCSRSDIREHLRTNASAPR